MNKFLSNIKYPLVVVSALKDKDRASVVNFLLKLSAPVYLEAISGIREEPALSHLRIYDVKNYPIDAVLRIGGVPTFRFWRDLEYRKGEVEVLSLNDLPFNGLSFGQIICESISKYLDNLPDVVYNFSDFSKWKNEDEEREQTRTMLFSKYPRAEQSFIHFLSKKIPEGSQVFLGNSLPIRNWDLAATYENRKFKIFASRGLNGIDGQISTFLGLARPGLENWAIIGDLTALHDLSGFWILKQLESIDIKIVIINNGGGKIFERKFSEVEFQNRHDLNFENLAKFWGIDYKLYDSISNIDIKEKKIIVELKPKHSEGISFQREEEYDRQCTGELARR